MGSTSNPGIIENVRYLDKTKEYQGVKKPVNIFDSGELNDP
jgi:hypothetical protein